MSAKSGWCLSNQHAACPVKVCPCSCHAQVAGQEPLLPDPRTTTEPPF